VIRQAERAYTDYPRSPGRRVRVGWSALPLMDAAVDPEVAATVEATALESLGHHVEEAAPEFDIAAMDRALTEIWYFRFDRTPDALAAQAGRAASTETVERATLAFYEFARSRTPDNLRILGLGRLRLQGPCGASDEFHLAAIAQNLGKLAKLIPMTGDRQLA
jgi:hypothetical protein